MMGNVDAVVCNVPGNDIAIFYAILIQHYLLKFRILNYQYRSYMSVGTELRPTEKAI